MDDTERIELANKFDKFLEENKLSVDEFCLELGTLWVNEGHKTDHPGVAACLVSAGEGLKHAGFDFYCSTK